MESKNNLQKQVGIDNENSIDNFIKKRKIHKYMIFQF